MSRVPHVSRGALRRAQHRGLRGDRAWRAALLVAPLLAFILLPSCGAAGATSADAAVAAPHLERFEPLRLASHGARAWRVLGRGLGQRGERALLRLVARSGTPFAGGTHDTLEAPAVVDSGRQVRGTLPDPGIPRTWGRDVEARVELELASGAVVTLRQGGALLEPTRLGVHAIAPLVMRQGESTGAQLEGEGFGPPGSEALVRFTSLVGTPFLEGTAAWVEVPGRVESPTTITFDPPQVRVDGTWFTEVEVRLQDGDSARSARWYARFEGPSPPPPFAVLGILPVTFGSRLPTVFQVQGSQFEPVGGRATVVFLADAGTPFRAGITDRLEVPVAILGPGTLRGLAPLPGLLGSADVVRARFEVHLADGRVGRPVQGSVAFVPHVGVDRVVINEVDYDQPGTDDAEFIELFNAGDGTADLARFRLDLVNGLGGGASVYRSLELPPVPLESGAWFVVAGNAATVPGAHHVVTPAMNLLQNGAPDAVALLRDDQLVDVISYEGDTGAPFVEGSGVGVEDDANVPGSAVARFLDGADSARNDVDFEARPRTPGQSNTGLPDRLLAAGAPGSVGGEGHLLALSPSEARGIRRGVIAADVGVDGLAFAPDGRLFATTRAPDGTCDLLAISPDDGQVLLAIGRLALDAASGQEDDAVPIALADLAADPADGMLFGLLDGGAGRGTLVTLETALARAEIRGELLLAAGESVAGLAFAPDGTLWAITCGTGARLLVLDPRDGAVRATHALGEEALGGLAVRPSDGALLAGRRDSDEIVIVAPDGGTTLLGATRAGAVGDLAFFPP